MARDFYEVLGVARKATPEERKSIGQLGDLLRRSGAWRVENHGIEPAQLLLVERAAVKVAMFDRQ